MMGGFLMGCVALSGMIPFGVTIAVVLMAIITFTAGLINRAAQHSATGITVGAATGITALVATIVLAIIYYRPTVEAWNTCGAVHSNDIMYGECQSMLIQNRFNEIKSMLRGGTGTIHNPSGWRKYLDPFTNNERASLHYLALMLALIPSTACIALPKVIEVFGSKCKTTGTRYEQDGKSKAQGSTDYGTIKPGYTTADYAVLFNEPVLAILYVASILYIFIDPPMSVSLFMITTIGVVSSCLWFFMSLQSDFIEEGAKSVIAKEQTLDREGTTFVGTQPQNHLPEKSNTTIITLMTMVGVAGPIGLLAAAVPTIVKYTQPTQISKIPLLVLAINIIAMRELLLAGVVLTAVLATARSYSAKVTTVKSEIVATEMKRAD